MVGCKKSSKWCLVPFLEIIYKLCNHASGRRDFHLAPDLKTLKSSRADSGNGRTRILMCMKCIGVRTRVLALSISGVIFRG
jgi:aconitate hydratase